MSLLADNHRTVTSSHIQSFGYDEGSQTLEVLFKKGAQRVYRYHGVPPNIVASLAQASSPGTYLHSTVIGYYRETKHSDQ